MPRRELKPSLAQALIVAGEEARRASLRNDPVDSIWQALRFNPDALGVFMTTESERRIWVFGYSDEES